MSQSHFMTWFLFPYGHYTALLASLNSMQFIIATGWFQKQWNQGRGILCYIVNYLFIFPFCVFGVGICCRFCGWCADDHRRFQFTLSQYTHDIPSHRALCMDLLQRLFPEKTRQELVSALAKCVREKVFSWLLNRSTKFWPGTYRMPFTVYTHTRHWNTKIK